MKVLLIAIALTVLTGCGTTDHIKLSSGRTFYKVYEYDDYGRTTLTEIKEVK